MKIHSSAVLDFLYDRGAYSRAALINFIVPSAALIRGRRLSEGGAYSSKYGTVFIVTIASAYHRNQAVSANFSMARDFLLFFPAFCSRPFFDCFSIVDFTVRD